MARRTKEEAAETRTRILDVAEQVFYDKGVSRTSLADIAAAAGVTRGAIYWHFRNKVDLFTAMMDRVTLPMEPMAFSAGYPALNDPLGQVRACALDVLHQAATNARVQRVFDIVFHKCEYVGEMETLKSRHLECRGKCLAEIERGFANAIRKGQLPAGVDPRRAAVGLHALIDGLLANWVLDPAYHPLAEEAEKIVDSHLAGLAAEPLAATKKNRSRNSKQALTCRAA